MKITLAMLTWNNIETAEDSAIQMLLEAAQLRQAGISADVVWVDNGSTDGTRNILIGQASAGVNLILNPRNLGSSVGRNQIIDHSLDSDYTLLTDGDIELVPNSAVEMLKYMESNPRLGCLGPSYYEYKTGRAETTQFAQPIESCTRYDLVAWTQYGMFKTDVFRFGMDIGWFTPGVRFCTKGEFGGPGWGWEDNEIMLQILKAGYWGAYFMGMRYLHRGAHKSKNMLIESGMDLNANWQARKDIMYRKWAGDANFERLRPLFDSAHPPVQV